MSSSFIGKVLDNYRILERLGVGGMGVVFKAIHIKLDKVFAIKIIAPGLAMNEHFIKRFQTEAKSLAKFEDPNIVRIYDLRTADDQWFIVMEYVDGTTLTEKILKDGAFHWTEALRIIKQVLSAVGHAHEAGIIHRDIKPNNIMLNDKGFVKITDFGLAKDQTQSTNTITVTSGGTLFYMSPEHVKGSSFIDARSDLYSVGMTLYEMLTSIVPFQNIKSDFEIRESIVRQEFEKPRSINPAIPAGLEVIVMRSISKNPDDRYQTADAMMKAISDFEAEMEISETKAEEKVTHTKDPLLNPVKPAKISAVPSPVKSPEPALKLHKYPYLKIAGVLAVLAAITLAIFKSGIFSDSLSSDIQIPVVKTQSRLTISSKPEASWVILSGDTIGQTPLTEYALLPGQYSLQISKDQYGSVDTTISLTENEDLGIAFTLHALQREQPPVQEPTTPPGKQVVASPSLAEVSIQSDPSGSEVWLNGTFKGRTPLQLSKITPGTHHIDIRQEGYETYLRDIHLEAGKNQRITAQMARYTGELSVTKDPPSAKVYLNGKKMNSQDLPEVKIDSLPAGKYLVEVTSPGYKSHQQSVEIQHNEITALNARLVRKEGNLNIQVRPWGSIYIDDQLHKQSSDVKYTVKLPAESHDIKIEHPTFGIWRKTVQISADEDIDILVNFTQEIPVLIKATDENDTSISAEIFIDGKQTGRFTPGVLSVRIGMHRVEVKKDGYGLDGGVKEILIDSDNENTLVYKLKGKDQ